MEGKPWCKFDKDKTGDEKKFEHQLADRGLDYYYADAAEAELSDEWDKYQLEKSQSAAKQDEKIAQEDDLCDDEDADTTDIKECKTESQMSKGIDETTGEASVDSNKAKLKKICTNLYGDWSNDPKKSYVKTMAENGKMVDVISKLMMKTKQINSAMRLIR